MQMRGIERLEMMGNLTASIVSHFGDTFLTVRSEAELSAGSLSTTGQWPAALGAGGSAVQLQLRGGGVCLQQMCFKEQRRGEGASFSSPREGANHTLKTYYWTRGEEEGL